MIGVLILAHGSRRAETEGTLKAIADYVRNEVPYCCIEESYLQFRDVNLEKGLLNLLEKGATSIKVVPYFLFEGNHIHIDIPEEIAAFQQKYPDIDITLGNVLGTDQRIAMVLLDRVKELVCVE